MRIWIRPILLVVADLPSVGLLWELPLSSARAWWRGSPIRQTAVRLRTSAVPPVPQKLFPVLLFRIPVLPAVSVLSSVLSLLPLSVSFLLIDIRGKVPQASEAFSFLLKGFMTRILKSLQACKTEKLRWNDE